MTRIERQAATRDALLDAAREAFLRDGYEGASLAAIADAAGCTTGAVYANFVNKDALLIAVLDERSERSRHAQIEHALPAETFEAAIAANARMLVGEFDADPRWAVLTAVYWARAAHDPTFRDAVAARHATILSEISSLLEKLARRFDRTPLIPCTEIARGGGALARGVRLERVLGLADDCTDAIFEAMFLAYVRALMPQTGEDHDRDHDH